MDISTITVADFKSQFYRDFPYLPVWDNTETYNTNDIVYYETNGLFYKCLNDGVTSLPTVTTDWERNIDSSLYDYVQDADIEKSFIEATINYNTALFGTDEEITQSYLYLAAHYLVNDLNNAINGIDSSGNFPINSKSAGSVSVGYAIPEAYTKNPVFSYYTSTGYGLKYLSMVLPRLIGNVQSVEGQTNA